MMPPEAGTNTEENTNDKDVLQVENEKLIEVDATSLSNNNDERQANPYKTASFLSKLLFKWPYKLMKVGMERPIEESDLPNIMQQDSSSHNLQTFEKLWQDEIRRVETLRQKLPNNSPKRNKINPNLHRALAIDFLKSTWIIQPMMFASSTARIVMSVALGNLTQSFIDKSKEGYMWAGILIACNLIVLLEHHHVFYITWKKGMNLRISSVAAIFSKSLRLKSVGGGSNSSISSGQIMNLVSNDVEMFMLTTLFISYILWAPLQVVAITILGLYLIGPAFAYGIAILVVFFVPLQFYYSKRFAILRSKVAAITDSRMTLVSQAINGVRVMKMSG